MNGSKNDEKISPPPVTGNIKLIFEKILLQSDSLGTPWGISFGTDGTLYVCDRANSRILRIDTHGKIISRFESSRTRTAKIFNPVDISVSSGISVFAIDNANSSILRFDRNLKNSASIYDLSDKTGKLFGSFGGITNDRISGDIFVTDKNSGSVIRIDTLGSNIRTTGDFGTGKKSLIEPLGIDVNENGSICIADRGVKAVALMKNFGSAISFIGSGILKAPIDAVFLEKGNILAVDDNGIVVFSDKGIAEGYAGFGTERIIKPRSAAFFDGKIYLSDGLTNSILVYRIEY